MPLWDKVKQELDRVRQAWRLIVRQGLHDRLVHQAKLLRELYGPRLPEDTQRVLADFLDRPGSLLGRLRHAATCDVYRQRALDGMIVRLMMFGGRTTPT